MLGRITTVLFALVFGLALTACSTPSTGNGIDSGAQPPSEENPSAGTRLAPGLYDLEGGTVQAIGTLEYVDLEGGFWAVIGGTAADGDQGRVVAVIANGAELLETIEPLANQQVLVTGARLEGASIRMAGPEIEADSIVVMDDTPGAAE